MIALAGVWKAVTSPLGVAIGGAVLATALLLIVFHKGEKAGSNAIRSEVEHTTNVETDKARRELEKAGEKTRNTPYNDRVDGLR